LGAFAQAPHESDARQLVREAVNVELAADRDDHSRWLYLEVDSKPDGTVKRWVAETSKGDLRCVLEENGVKYSEQQQQQTMNEYVQNTSAQAQQQKGSKHDDEQATEMLGLLPNAFLWTKVSDQNGETTLHFSPDPNFQPPDWESRVFAAMEGEMKVDDAQHRIASLKGKLIRDVKFGFGILGDLKAGGTFNVERRELSKGIWQITETHVHIDGRALLFKSISEQEDDVKQHFKQLPQNLTLQQAEGELLQVGDVAHR
jgi:hypothetical protein